MLVGQMTAERHPDAGLSPDSSDDGVFSLDERLAAASDLSRSERAVARYFAEHRDVIPFMSTTEIAAAAGVGTASVVRAAQRLGYQGLLALKRELRMAMQTRTAAPPGPEVDTPNEEVPRATRLFERAVEQQIEALAGVLRSVRRPAFDESVRLLAEADRVVILIGGFSGGLAQYLGRWLRSSGRRILLVDSPDVAEVMVELGPGDCLVALAFEELSDRLTAALDIAQRSSVPTVLITDTFALALKGRYAAALTVRAEDVFGQPSGVPIVSVIDALLVGVSARFESGT
jgi:DNA-binding MurR/RpiR family transcriptional regulator